MRKKQSDLQFEVVPQPNEHGYAPKYSVVVGKWRTNYNGKSFGISKGEINNMPSMTIPDQSLTIPELIERFVRGIPVTVGKIPIYDEDTDILDGIDPRTMDIEERKQFVKNTQDELFDLNQKFKNDEKRKKKAEYDAIVEKQKADSAKGSKKGSGEDQGS